MSELRQDLISGDWVIIAPGRAARPKYLDAKPQIRKPSPKSTCPFENPKETGNWPPFHAYPNIERWRTIVLPNKYPAVEEHKGVCSVLSHDGLHSARTAVGQHRLIITRDHSTPFADLDIETATEVFKAFREQTAEAAKDPCLNFAASFFNWGPAAGASVWHPHYQFLSLPVIPAHSARSIEGARRYHKKHHHCALCDIIRFERKQKKRVIFENNLAIAIAPYASKFPFEIRIVPKSHSPYFYKSSDAERKAVASALQKILHGIKKILHDPDLNVFIHEAPLDGKKHNYHHWHAEVIPRISTPAGFELSTGIIINTVEPEQAASLMKAR